MTPLRSVKRAQCSSSSSDSVREGLDLEAENAEKIVTGTVLRARFSESSSALSLCMTLQITRTS
jgi:hypothetical protein